MDVTCVNSEFGDLAAGNDGTAVDLGDHVGRIADDGADFFAFLKVKLAIDERLCAQFFDDFDKRLDDGVGRSGDKALFFVEIFGTDAQRDGLSGICILFDVADARLNRLGQEDLIVDKFDWLAYNGNSPKAKFFITRLLFIGHDKRGEKMKLQDLASVRSGLVLSRKQAKEPSEYRYPLINLRCIQQEGTIQLKEADIYEAKEPLKEEYLSQSGDIIVRLTAPYTAVLIDETTSGMVVSSNFVVIRVEDKNLLPEYLFWLLNTEKIKRKIYENATSNMLGAVNARFLADFELALLSVEDQRKISQFNLLAKRERQLLRMLADEKEKYYAGVLNQAYKRAKKGK